MKKEFPLGPSLLESADLDQVTGGKTMKNKREKYVSAFYCEYCGKTIHLNAVYSLERAKKEHNAKFHPTLVDSNG